MQYTGEKRGRLSRFRWRSPFRRMHRQIDVELADEIELRTFTDVERLMEPPDGIEPGTFDHFCDRCCCYRILALCCILILPTAVVIVYLHLKLA